VALFVSGSLNENVTIGKVGMTENEPGSATLTARQRIQMACAVALAAGVSHHYYAKPDEWTPLWMLDMFVIAAGGIVGVATLLRRPPPPEH